MNKLPDFICVGAQKAGTTSLHDILKQHPDIYLPEIKETKYFQDNEKYKNGLEFYMSEYFSTYNNENIVGEIDPEYMYFDYVPERIYRDLGADIKLVFMLRNPASRAFSHYLMSLKRGYENLEFSDAIAKEKTRFEPEGTYFDYKSNKNNLSYIDRGMYHKQILRYLKYFPIDNMFFIVFEDDFLKNKRKTLDKLFKFLNIPADKHLNINLKSNFSAKPRSVFVRNLLYKEHILSKIAKSLIWNPHFRSRIKNILNTINQKNDPSKLSEVEKFEIINFYYIDEIKKLETLIGRDLSTWIN